MEIYKKMHDYMESYDKSNPKIKIKIQHTYSVVAKAQEISKSLSLNKEDTNLAIIIALLHDIGRFEQLKRYNSFIDHLTVDHASLGIQILFEEHLIEHFLDTREYDSMIYYAIANHNRLKIEPGLDKRTLLHCKIIRDADKLDNLEIKCKQDFEDVYGVTKEQVSTQTISKKVYDALNEHRQINARDRVTDLDVWLTHIGFVYDFNFAYSLKETLENNYASIILHQIACKDKQTVQQIEEIDKVVNQYMKEQLYEK